MAKKPEVTTQELATLLSKHGVQLFREYSGMTLNQAQRNLEGKTPYVDDATLKSFGAKVHSCNVMDDGLILGLVESLQKSFNPDEGRVFRPVFFDVFGNVVYRPEIEKSFATQKQAMSAFWKQSDEIDAIESTLEGAKARLSALKHTADQFSKLVDELNNE